MRRSPPRHCPPRSRTAPRTWQPTSALFRTSGSSSAWFACSRVMLAALSEDGLRKGCGFSENRLADRRGPYIEAMGALSRGQRRMLAVTALVTVAAGVAHFAASDVAAFIVAGLALATLAWAVSFATEQLGTRVGPGMTGFLQSTLGNLPELFVVLFALSSGNIVVAQTSILGSLFANALLVLGAVIVVGARHGGGQMTFSTRLPNDTATLLLVATFIIT